LNFVLPVEAANWDFEWITKGS